MPFPSRACKTCRQRHVKCDETYPICNRCVKAGKTCLGFKIRPDQLAFRDENDFAGGMPRRPRDSCQITPNSKTQLTTRTKTTRSTSVVAVTATVFTSSSSVHDTSTCRATRLVSIPRSLDLSLESYAFADFAGRYVNSQHNLSNGQWSHLKYYRTEWESTEQRSGLGLAATALALALFGRTKAAPSALKLSIEKYNEAVSNTRLMLQDSCQIPQDRTLVTIMLLDAYEGTVGGKNGDWWPPERSCHQNGATMLLKLRKDNPSPDRHTSSLDMDIRRRLIRTSIMQGSPLPDWLHEGVSFGETGEELGLDRCLIQVCNLRHKIQTFLDRHREGFGLQKRPFAMTASDIVKSALAVDDALVAWAQSLPLNWQIMGQEIDANSDFNTHDTSGYSSSTFQDLNIVSTWNTYRAARLVTNSIMARVLASSLTARKDVVDATIRQLIREILATTPLFLGNKFSVYQQSSPPVHSHTQHGIPDNATAAEAGLLVFPLCVAATVSTITEADRGIILAQISLLSKVTGSCTLETFASGAHFTIQ